MTVASRAVHSSVGEPDGRHPADASSDSLAFDAVYRETAAFVWRSLRRMGVPEAHVADATQEVFLVVYGALGRFEGRSALRTWVFGIVLRVASQWRRKVRARPTEPLPEVLPDDTRGTPFDHAAHSEANEILGRLLDRLSPDQRAVFLLVELEQMSVPEAAEVLGANLHTLTSRLKAARRNFEAALRRHTAKSRRGSP